MKRRYVGEPDGRLLDRQNRPLGNVTIREDGMVLDGERPLGRVTSITIDDTGLDAALPPHTPPSLRDGQLELSGQELSDKLPLSLMPSSVDEVGSHYMEVMKPRWTQLPPDERRIISEALKVASVDELKTVIDACASSTFHMGQNPQRKRYNSLGQIMKGRRENFARDGRRIPARTTRETIDFFLDLADKSQIPGSSSVLSDEPATLRRETEIALDDLAHKVSLMLERPFGVNLADGLGAIEILARYGLEIALDEARTRVVRLSVVPVEDARIMRVQPLLAERLQRALGLV